MNLHLDLLDLLQTDLVFVAGRYNENNFKESHTALKIFIYAKKVLISKLHIIKLCAE